MVLYLWCASFDSYANIIQRLVFGVKKHSKNDFVQNSENPLNLNVYGVVSDFFTALGFMSFE